jgi:hypothetical protein
MEISRKLIERRVTILEGDLRSLTICVYRQTASTLIDKQQRTTEEYMITEKAGRILQSMKKRDTQTLKHWKPYTGPPDWSFAVLNAPNKQVEEGKDESPEVSNG